MGGICPRVAAGQRDFFRELGPSATGVTARVSSHPFRGLAFRQTITKLNRVFPSLNSRLRGLYNGNEMGEPLAVRPETWLVLLRYPEDALVIVYQYR